MNYYYLTGYSGEAAKRLLYDLNTEKNVEFIDDEIRNRYIRFLYYRIQDLIGSLNNHKRIKSLFYRFFYIYQRSYSVEKGIHCIIFFNSMFTNGGYDGKFIRLFKKKHPMVKLIMYIVDPYIALPEDLKNDVIPLFDKVYAINRKDCEEHGYTYYPLVYSKIDYENQCKKPKSDLYYLGSGRDRTEQLHDLYHICLEEGVTADFRVMDEGIGKRKYTDELTYYLKSISYAENLQNIFETRCMLEIMHRGFDNPTQRYLEAVVYNKKLLTNNSEVAKFDYYNPQYMKIFTDIGEIDWEWVKKDVDIDYMYQGDFSPQLFISRIEKDII